MEIFNILHLSDTTLSVVGSVIIFLTGSGGGGVFAIWYMKRKAKAEVERAEVDVYSGKVSVVKQELENFGQIATSWREFGQQIEDRLMGVIQKQEAKITQLEQSDQEKGKQIVQLQEENEELRHEIKELKSENVFLKDEITRLQADSPPH